MSLDVLAQHLASKGRNGDSMLVHMTPGEVHGLHALALAHGGKLTINPDTGLPEANFLKKLLPMIAGAALNFFAPGIGTAIGSALGGLSGAAGSAIAVGGITGLATGSLQKGLMAGLGAYGGAGLSDALMSGAGAAGAAGALGVEGAATGAGSQAAMLAEQTAGFGGEGLKRLAESAGYAKGATPSLSAAFSAGADAAMKNPGAFLKDNAKSLMYAAAPIMADQAVPTVTKSPGETGYIRPFVYDAATFGQGPQGLQALPPVPANQISYGPPPGGANGGLVALANGGWTGDVPDPGDPRRKEFEQYLASQMTPDQYAQLAANPGSVLSPGFSERVQRETQGRQQAVAQGLDDPYSSYTRPINTLEDVRQRFQAVTLAGNWHGATDDNTKDLNEIVSQYVDAATSGKIQRAAALASRFVNLGGLGFVNPTGGIAGINDIAELLRPGFKQEVESLPRENNPYGWNTLDAIRSLSPRAYYDSTSYGDRWRLVAAEKARGDFSNEDIALAYGLPKDFVDKELAQRPTWTKDAQGYLTEGKAPRSVLPTGTGEAPAPTPEPPPAPTPETQTPALDYITGRTPDTGTVAPSPKPDPRFDTPYPEPTPAPAPAPAPVIKTPEATVTPGTGIGGGVTTPTTPTTPTFELPREEQIFKTPVGTITGGTVTGTVDTKEALREYERTAPTGKPPAITSDSTLLGYKGQDKTYGGVEKPYVMPTPAALGTAGSISRGTETMDDVRRLTGNRYDQAPSTFTPSISGASKSAYDFLMGKGAYPTDQFDRTEVGPIRPLWRPYVQGVAGAADAFAPRTAAPTAQFGFKPPTVGTVPTTGTQRWKNTKTGEIYLAPAGYAPPSNDWVLDTQSNALDPALQGGGDDAGAGVGSGTASDGGSADGDGSGVGDGTGGVYASGGLMKLAMGGYAQGGYNLGSYSDGGRLLRGPGDGVSDDIPATIGDGQPARLADGEFVVPARIVSELGNGSTEAGARQLYAMMDRVQRARNRTVGKDQVAANTNAARFLPA